jgi:hypothetical protein
MAKNNARLYFDEFFGSVAGPSDTASPMGREDRSGDTTNA